MVKYVSAGSLTRERGKKSLLIRRDAALRVSDALHLGIFEQLKKMILLTGAAHLGRWIF